MSGKRVVAKDISVGQPLPWDVYDSNDKLLLRRGYVIETQSALDRLVYEGIFLDAKDSGAAAAAAAATAAAAAAAAEPPSALQYIVDARRLMGSPTQDLAAIRDFPGRMLKIAQLIDHACQTNAEVALASILLLQDDYYFVRHHVNAAVISNLLARAMNMTDAQVRSVSAAALTMNISMYEVQDKLHDVKGQLNEKLRALINVHPQQSEQRLRKFGVTDPYWLRCVEQHHEHEDGSGYPKGLRGGDIETGAKILCLADKYCARVSLRNYRATQPPSAVLRDLYIERGATIDTIVAAQLIRILGVYPPGTIVRLHNGEVAVVVRQAENPETPIAYAVLNPSGSMLAVPSLRKTEREELKIQDVLTLDKIDFQIQMSRLWGPAAKVG